MESVCAYGIYGEVGKRIFYHMQCLEMIEVNPEKHGHIMMDKAIHINERRKECLQYNDTIEEQFIKKAEKLNRNNFERMLPTWSRK